MADVSWIRRGRYRVLLHASAESPELRDALFRLPSLLAGDRVRILQAGRHVTYRLSLPVSGGKTIDAVVKRFGRQSLFKDLWDRFSGSKALRSYLASDYLHGAKVGTIPPVACVERWGGLRLHESYFVSLYLSDTVCLKDELVDLWRRGATYHEFHGLMRLVGDGIRALHDAGCLHNDLGNQNIQLTRSVPGGPFTGVAFLDHNRARLGIVPTRSDRARDLARLVWPSGLFGEFFRLYWHGDPPADFLAAYGRHWLRFRIHSRTRRFRHPIREIRYRLHPETAPAHADYPPLRDQWIWDAERFEPAPVLSRRDFARMAGTSALRDGRRSATELETALPALLDGLRRPSTSRARLRIWIDASEIASAERLVAGAHPEEGSRLLLALSGAESAEALRDHLAAVRRLSEGGTGVALVVCQTRDLIRGPGRWRSFADAIVRDVGGAADWISFGAGATSYRWGVTDATDCKTLLSAPGPVQGSPALLAPAVAAPVADDALGVYRKALGEVSGRYAGQVLVLTPEMAADEKSALRQIASMRFLSPLPLHLLVKGSLSLPVLERLRSVEGVAEIAYRL